MTRLTESAIEDFAIKLFERLGYSYVYGPDIAPDGEHPERGHYGEVLLAGRLEQALKRINPKLQSAVLQAALKEVPGTVEGAAEGGFGWGDLFHHPEISAR